MKIEGFNVLRHEGTLDNGIKVVLFKKDKSPIYIRTVIKAGSCYDPKGKEGLSHFLEHMICNGSTKFPSKDLLSERIDSVGGIYGLFINNQLININIEIASKKDIDVAIELLDSFLVTPLLDKNKFDNEKDVILAELGRSQSNPSKILYNTAIKHEFLDSGFGHPVIGFKESVQKIVYSDILEAKDRLIGSDRMNFVVAGDIELKDLLKELNKLLLPTTNSSAIARIDYSLEFKTGVVRNFDNNFKQSFIFYGFKDASRFSEEATYLGILGNIITRVRSGKFYKILRQDKGLIYGLNWNKYKGEPFGVVGIFTDTTKEKTDLLLTELKNCFDNIEITEEDLERAKKNIVKSLIRTMQTSEDWVNFHSDREIFAPDNNKKIEQYISLVEKTTYQNLLDVVKKYIDPKRNIIIIVN